MSSLIEIALPHVAAMHAYTPGLQPTELGWVKLNTNENPYPPSPRAAAAIAAELADSGERLRLYPNPKSTPLRQLVARLHGHALTEANVLIGNGSDDVLNLLVRVFGGPDAPTSFTLPSYSLYPVLIAIQDGRAVPVPFDRTMKLPVAALAATPARACFLTSPNAPTGIGFSNTEIAALLARFPGVLVLDETYAPFAQENAVALLAAHPRLVITRSLSKAQGLAGLRVGYCLAHPDIIDLLDRVRDSYNVNRLSQAGAFAALSDGDYYAGIIGKIIRTRDYWFAELSEKRGWFTYESQANFLFTEPKSPRGESGPAVAKSLYDFFLSRRILVRAFPAHPLTASFLRISIGNDEEMAAVDEAIEAWLKAGA
ncbi:MAG: aminotransferase class I/II-fold pyridoxal phosphate-dependent enzyme [Verrucomicrobia bacterium]|nr:MAG: aminotransferase class I/II-fold pyridoxal phosphate-dependent enzyme [Verrucomicrobiota bacterium]